MQAKPNKRILVVDDSPTILKILAKGIQSLGYEAVQAVDGLDALEKLAREPVNLVMTDLNMPRMDGFELIRQIRNIPALSVLPIVVLTSEVGDKAMAQALDAGANIYLRKPASMPKLKYKVQSLLGDSPGIPDAEEAMNATIAAEGDASRAIGHARSYRSATQKMTKVSPDVQLEMYLFADSEPEAQLILNAILENRALTSADVLPSLMDESLTKNEWIRLFRLMSAMRSTDFALPALRQFHRFEDADIRVELLKTVGHCGRSEFVHDLQELYHSEAASTVHLSESVRKVLNAFETALEIASANDEE